ncbi:winged helix-turn-helix domain-containing protein, partial [Roseateles sp. P5_E11]
MPATEPARPPTQPLRFGPGGRFELRPAEYRLLVDGEPSALGGRALDLLLTLAARPAELFTKAELIERVWPGLVVEEGNLRVQVNALRRLLGEDAIATVPGRGYRFTAARHDEAQAAAAPLPAPATTTLFGRDADLARLRQALAAPGCVSVVGSPGVG